MIKSGRLKAKVTYIWLALDIWHDLQSDCCSTRLAIVSRELTTELPLFVSLSSRWLAHSLTVGEIDGSGILRGSLAVDRLEGGALAAGHGGGVGAAVRGSNGSLLRC